MPIFEKNMRRNKNRAETDFNSHTWDIMHDNNTTEIVASDNNNKNDDTLFCEIIVNVSFDDLDFTCR